MEIPFTNEPLRYKYFVADKGVLTWEKGPERILELELAQLDNTFILKDEFRLAPVPEHEIFSSSAFREVIFRREERKSIETTRAEDSSAYYKAMVLGKDAILLRLTVFAGRVRPSDEVCMVGSLDELGKNDPARAIPLSDSRAPFWTLALPLHPDRLTFTYKLLIREKGRGNKIQLVEEGDPRPFSLTDVERLVLSKCASECDTSFLHPFDVITRTAPLTS